MKHLNLIIIILAIAVSAPSIMAQRKDDKLTDATRQSYMDEMRNYKHEFLARQLDLSKEQQREFWPIYDEMDKQLMQIGDETRQFERKISQSTDATNTEYTAAARALFEQKSREGEIEMQYYDKFQKILNPKQLAKLKIVERAFVRHLMREHHNRRK